MKQDLRSELRRLDLKRGVCIVILILVLMTSCAHLSPFTEEKPFVSTLNPVESVIFTQKLSLYLEDYDIELSRLTLSFDPSTGSCFGALEGRFPRWKANYFIKHKYNGSFELACPSSGIILFSNDSIDHFLVSYKQTLSLIDYDVCRNLIDSDSGFYIENPSVLPDLGFNTSKINLEKISSILCISDGVKSDFTFSLENEIDCNSLVTVIKASLAAEFRKKGNKIDIEYLNTLISTSKNNVFLKNQDFVFNISSYFDFSVLEVK